MRMRKSLTIIMILVAMTLCFTLGAKADTITINFASAPANGLISFSGGNFTFVNSFSVTSSAPFATINGFTGTIGGTFQIGTVGAGGLGEIATVTPIGGGNTFTINDGGTPFTATVAWFQISTTTNGAIGGLNPELVMNLTNFEYNGSNPELLALLACLQGTGIVSWQFASNIPPVDLNALRAASASHPIMTSYSGSISAVPVPPTALLLGSGLLGLVGLGRLRKRN